MIPSTPSRAGRQRARRCGWAAHPGGSRGFTLVEMLIAMTVLIIVVTAILGTNLLGLRMMTLNSTKLAATEWSRDTFGKLTADVHSCNSVYVGSLSNGAFAGLLPGEPQVGFRPQPQGLNHVLILLVFK